MRKKLIAILLCMQLVISIVKPAFPMAAASAQDGETTSSESVNNENNGTGSTSTTTSLFPECALTWMSYKDYLKQQVNNAKENPAVYVGYEVSFLVAGISTLVASGFENGDITQGVLITDGETQARTENHVSVDLKLVIDDYYYDENTKYLWYKVKAAEGQVLPAVLQQCPYVLYMDYISIDYDFDYYPPVFNIGALRGIFTSSDTVNVKRSTVAASAWKTFQVSSLVDIFDVKPLIHYDEEAHGKIVWGDHYDIGGLADSTLDFRYVVEKDITLIPAEATVAYEALMATEDTQEYYACMGEIPDGVLALFSARHRANLDAHIASLSTRESTVYDTTTATINGVEVPISVIGNIPEGMDLVANSVSQEEFLGAGFDIDPEDLVVALDIKVLDSEGEEWQPDEGRRVGVSIEVGELGYEDGTVLSLQHKHGERIEKLDVVVVENGAITVYTSGFSIYAVSTTSDKSTANQIPNNGTVRLEVGQTKIYYFVDSSNSGNGAWDVYDPDGAIYYTVHATTTTLGNGGMQVRWIKVVALKTSRNIKLTYRTTSNNTNNFENFNLQIVTPTADNENDGRKLYIQDNVNASGKITVQLVKKDGITSVGLEGASFTWTRTAGGKTYFINPDTYDDGYQSVNIARDHGGLVEDRKDDKGFIPTTYTVEVVLADGEKKTASYTVYYQSEIINAGFEFPKLDTTSKKNFIFFPNGWPELYWKTTAPGTGAKVSMDIEYGFYSDKRDAETSFGVTGDASPEANTDQFAEINAEAVGALYQDIITVPGEEIVWSFSHAPRQDMSWGQFTNAMYIIIGATENAQTLLHSDIVSAWNATAKNAIADLAEKAAGNDQTFKNGQRAQEVQYEKGGVTATYFVWYHDAEFVESDATYDKGWTPLNGTYTVPEGQYRTRIFFVSKPEQRSQSYPNAGNLIDAAQGGQYKTYRIDFYILEDGQQNPIPQTDHSITGKALLYSSVPLGTKNDETGEKTGLQYFLSSQYFDETDGYAYLYKIMINGANYPYNISHTNDTGSLYIQKYDPVTGFNQDGAYTEDIVMQVYLRKVVISVQVELVFPTQMTDEQKLSVIQQNNYMVSIGITSDEIISGNDRYSDSGNVSITKRDPTNGKYAGYYSVSNYPTINHSYTITQSKPMEIEGLIFDESRYTVTYYVNGGFDTSTTIVAKDTDSFNFDLLDGKGFAEIVIQNVYIEKTTTIYYQAVGNGKVAFRKNPNLPDGELDFVDTPSEQLAFYSGKSIGAVASEGSGATFVGWYKDPECKEKVTAVDGAVDGKIFKPNANILNEETVTFYAKFVTGSIEIERKNANPNEIFVYHVTGTTTDQQKIDLYVTLKCDQTGAGTVTISEVPYGSYKVIECRDWNWRYLSSDQEATISAIETKVFTFNSTPNEKQWINGFATSSAVGAGNGGLSNG